MSDTAYLVRAISAKCFSLLLNKKMIVLNLSRKDKQRKCLPTHITTVLLTITITHITTGLLTIIITAGTLMSIYMTTVIFILILRVCCVILCSYYLWL